MHSVLFSACVRVWQDRSASAEDKEVEQRCSCDRNRKLLLAWKTLLLLQCGELYQIWTTFPQKNCGKDFPLVLTGSGKSSVAHRGLAGYLKRHPSNQIEALRCYQLQQQAGEDMGLACFECDKQKVGLITLSVLIWRMDVWIWYRAKRSIWRVSFSLNAETLHLSSDTSGLFQASAFSFWIFHGHWGRANSLLNEVFLACDPSLLSVGGGGSPDKCQTCGSIGVNYKENVNLFTPLKIYKCKKGISGIPPRSLISNSLNVSHT